MRAVVLVWLAATGLVLAEVPGAIVHKIKNPAILEERTSASKSAGSIKVSLQVDDSPDVKRELIPSQAFEQAIAMTPQLEQPLGNAPNAAQVVPMTPVGAAPPAPANLEEHSPAKPHTSPRDILLLPAYGPTSGGTWVQIVGAGSFHTPNSLQCKMDMVEQYCYSNHYYYSWCYLTPKCAGTYSFKCHNGPMQFEGKYAVVAKTPWVTSVYPFSGETTGGTPVTVRGWGFEPHCPSQLLCRFGDQVVPAKYYTPTLVMCIAPCATRARFASVETSNDGGKHWSQSGVQFSFVGEAPTPEEMKNCQRYLSKDHMLDRQRRLLQLEEKPLHSTALREESESE